MLLIYSSIKKYIYINILFFICANNSYAQTGQVKATFGQVIDLQPNIITQQANTNGYGVYATDGGIVHSGTGNVVTNGSNAAGLFASEPTSVIYWQGTNITTNGLRGRGIDTVRGGQVIGFGSVTTNGDKAHGIQAGDTNATAGIATVTLTSGTSVHTFGNGSYGLHAYATGIISGTANIITEGTSSFGAHAEKNSSITLQNSNLETHGLNAIGLLANTDGIVAGTPYTPGQLNATSTIVKTTNNNAFGALADVEASINLSNVTIETLGENAAGLVANRGGIIISQGHITTAGNSAYGVVAGMTAQLDIKDTIKHSGSVVTKGDNAHGAFAQNGAELTLNGTIQTQADMSYGALIDGAKLSASNLDLTTSGDHAIGLYVKNDGLLTGQTKITTTGTNAHGLNLENGATAKLDNSYITTHGSVADGVIVNNSTLVMNGGKITSEGHAISIRDGNNITLHNTSAQSKLGVIDIAFTKQNQHVDLNITGNSQLHSETGNLLSVIRDTTAGATGSVSLTIADHSIVNGDMIDSGEKTTGYTDILLGGDVSWAGRVAGIRNFISLSGSARISFTAGSILNGDLHGIGSNFTFDDNGIIVAGDLLLYNNSRASGGSQRGSISVAGNVLTDETSSQRGNWVIAGNLENRGIISPGNSVGTITVGGNYVLSNTSVYQVEINAAGESDLITVAGSASLAGHVSLTTTGDGLGFSLNHRYTILSATGGLNGTIYGGGLDWLNAPIYLYVAPQLSYDANNVYLTLRRNNILIANSGITPNEQAVGYAIDHSGPSALTNAFLLQTASSSTRAALQRLSGEAYPTILGALHQDSHHTRDAITERLHEAAVDDGSVLWGHAIGMRARSNATAGYAGLKQNTNGFYFGGDTPLSENYRIGLMAGIEKTNFYLDDLYSSANVDSYHLGAYGNWQQQALALRLGTVYSRHNISMNRSFSIFNTPQALDNDYKAQSIQIFGEAGYQLKFAGFDIEPFAGLAYVRSRSEGFNEHSRASGFDVALNAESSTLSNTFSTLGIRLERWLGKSVQGG